MNDIFHSLFHLFLSLGCILNNFFIFIFQFSNFLLIVFNLVFKISNAFLNLIIIFISRSPTDLILFKNMLDHFEKFK